MAAAHRPTITVTGAAEGVPILAPAFALFLAAAEAIVESNNNSRLSKENEGTPRHSLLGEAFRRREGEAVVEMSPRRHPSPPQPKHRRLHPGQVAPSKSPAAQQVIFKTNNSYFLFTEFILPKI